MAKLLFRLKDVPQQEADDIRNLLDEHGFDCYETGAGRWQVGVDAIWLRDDAQFDAARALIDAYQNTLAQHNISNLEPVLSWQQYACRHPVRFIAGLLAVAVVLVLSVLPFALI